MLAFEYPIRPFTFGPRSSPFFATPSFGSWRRGAWAGWGSGPLGAPRHAAPAVVGRFIFFRDLAFFGDSEDSGFAGHGRRTTDDETGLPPDPLLRTENRQIFIANFFFQKKFWRQSEERIAPMLVGQGLGSIYGTSQCPL